MTDEIQRKRDLLDVADDEVCAAIGRLELALAAIRVGVPVELLKRVAYDKHRGTWGIWVVDHRGWSRLCDCRRDDRARILAEILPIVLTQVEAALTERLTQRRGLVGITDTTIAALRILAAEQDEDD